LQAAYDGFSADGMKQLVQIQEGKNRQSAWDICFSAPKSVSVLWSTLGPADRHRIEELVMEAAKKAVDYIDASALFTRRGKLGTQIERAKGVYALCPHGTSRALDPQLHVHALCMNICLRADGTTGTIRSRDLYEHKMAAGAVFRLELAFLLLQELGLLSSPDPELPWSFVLDGVSPELCREQSKRRQAIEQLAKEEGWTSPKVMAQLALATRKAKGRVNLKACFEQWQETAAKYGLTREAANQLLTRGQQRVGELSYEAVIDARRDETLSQAVDQAVKAIARSESYFPERKVVQEASALVQGKGFSADQMIDAVKQKLGAFENYVEYANHGAVVLSKHKAAAIEKLVANYSQVLSQDLPKVAALVNTNQEARSINQAMQQKRKAVKELSLSSIKLPNGERVHTGDIVALRHNDYRLGVRNGIRGTVIGIERTRGMVGPGTLQIHLHGEHQSGLFSWRPKVVAIDLKDYEKVQLGYAITTHMAQGITLDKTHILMGDSMQSKNMAYTQLTRHRDECKIYGTEAEYGDSLEVIAKDISRSVEKDMALDYRLRKQQLEREAAQQAQLEQDGYDQSLSIF
jgi:conjugative relaxase-like TrwC/TraI family protein